MSSFFDQIEQNKRNSVILLVFMLVLVFAVLWAASLIIFGDSPIGFILVAILSVAYVYFVYKNASKIILSFSSAKPADKLQYPYLHNVVEGLSLAAGIPTPKIYIIDEPGLNAFATGFSPENSAVAFTRGLVEKLNRAELEGVAAHEISHIKNLDVRFATLAVALMGLVVMISDILIRVILRSRRGSREVPVPLLLIALVIIVLSPFFAILIRFALSRQREYLADATAVQLTRYPEGLACALEKISKLGSKVSVANDATAQLYFASPLGASLFSTHPPIEERIKRLRQM
ncbi:MAG: M48 family metalloprotease [Candidatus Anstonellaceae archaeon]